MRRVTALVALFLVAACGSIGVQAHTVSLAYKAGDTYKYALHAVLNYTIGAQGLSLPLNVEMSGKENVKVKSVDSSGTADLSIDLTNLSVKTTVNGTTNTTTTTTPTSIEVKVGSDGRIVSVNGSAFGSSGTLPGMSGADGGLVSAILPDRPVKPGDTWTKSFDQTSPLGSTGSYHVTTDNKYLRDEKIAGVEAAVVESRITGALDLTFNLPAMSGQAGNPLFPSGGPSGELESMSMKGTAKSDVTTWIDSSARRIVKSHSTGSIDATLTLNMTPGTGTTTPGLTGPITIKGTLTLDMKPV